MSEQNTPHPPEPIPIPEQPDFPVTWANPEEAQIPWELDRMHWPDPMPPLEGEFWARCLNGVKDSY